MRTFALFIILFCLFLISSCSNQENNSTSITISPEDTVGISLSNFDELHHRNTLKPKDRSLVEYINSAPNKLNGNKKVVYLMPFGHMKPEVEEIINQEVDYLECFLQVPVKILDRVSYDEIKSLDQVKTRMVPENDFAYFSKMKGDETQNLREQIQASSFIDQYIMKHQPEDAIAVLGITEHDIYNPKYNYLFGSSKLKGGAGLVSTYRLIDYGDQTKYNIRKVISKQLVNLFSIKNVKDYECLLNFHNSKEELEAGSFIMSPKALEKLKYSVGFDYSKRFKDLRNFWMEEGNKQMVEYYESCLKKF